MKFCQIARLLQKTKLRSSLFIAAAFISYTSTAPAARLLVDNNSILPITIHGIAGGNGVCGWSAVQNGNTIPPKTVRFAFKFDICGYAAPRIGIDVPGAATGSAPIPLATLDINMTSIGTCGSNTYSHTKANYTLTHINLQPAIGNIGLQPGAGNRVLVCVSDANGRYSSECQGVGQSLENVWVTRISCPNHHCPASASCPN